MLARVKKSLRHVVPLVAGASVAAALVLAPVPVQAAVISGANNVAQTSFVDNGPATCSVTNAGSNSSAPFTSNGVTSTRSLSHTSTITDTGDATDVTTLTASSKSTVRATEAGGTLKTLDWRATLKASANAAQGINTDCDAQATASAVIIGTFTNAKPRWLTLSGDLDAGLVTVVVVVRTSPATPAWNQTFVLVGGHSQPGIKSLIPAGSYIMQLVMQNSQKAPTVAGDPNPVSLTADGHINGTFVPIGTATSKAIGPASKYLKFPGARKCAQSKLVTKFKPAAGDGPTAKIKKATFYVNGHKVKTVNLPIRNQKTTLTGLPSGDAVTVKAKLNLFAGGAVSASRSYLSCT